MTTGSGGDLAVEGGNVHASLFPFRFELSPDVGGAGVEAEDSALHAVAK